MLFLHNFERFNNLHSYHGRVGGNQLPPISLLLPRMTGRNIRPPVIYFPNWPPLRLRRAHYFRMRDHGSSLFSAVKNLHLPGGWGHTGTPAIVVSPRASNQFDLSEIYLVRLRSTVTGCRQPHVLGISQTFIRSLSPVKAKVSIVKGGVEPERFSLVWGFLAHKRKRKRRKKCLARWSRLQWLEKLPCRALVVGESPKATATLWIGPIPDDAFPPGCT